MVKLVKTRAIVIEGIHFSIVELISGVDCIPDICNGRKLIIFGKFLLDLSVGIEELFLGFCTF